ncbi:MAG: cytochrome c [Isosphaeraceae bacterium]|nr:cytochrome c [Isosphaeraceae bacterium]
MLRACCLAGAAGLAFLAGCRQEMYNQPRFEPLEEAEFFDDGASARPLIEGTVARVAKGGVPLSNTHFYTGKVNGKDAETFPFPIDRSDLERGRDRYMIYCSPCHGALGDGRGMIVARGFPPPPPFYGKLPKTEKGPVSVYDDLREAPVGHFFEVITNGHGIMYSYASRISPEDRWKIAAYIRALQLSQYATVEDLKGIKNPTPEEQRLLREATP